MTIPVSSKDVDGSLKDSMQDVLRDNWSTPPVEIFQKKIKNIPPDVYAAGNRSAAGTLKKAQHAKSSMRLQSSRLAELHQLLLLIDKDQRKRTIEMPTILVIISVLTAYLVIFRAYRLTTVLFAWCFSMIQWFASFMF